MTAQHLHSAAQAAASPARDDGTVLGLCATGMSLHEARIIAILRTAVQALGSPDCAGLRKLVRAEFERAPWWSSAR